MKVKAASFDRLARNYRVLEFAAFGRDLERARFCLLDHLRDCRHILVLGEGDGRCLAQLVQIAPAAQIHCIDLSAAMLERAAARIAGTEAEARVTFACADVLSNPIPAHDYDAVITLFFLDCFTAEQVAKIVAQVKSTLQPGAHWLFADFVLPARGPARLRARLWLAMLYAFFRWQADLSVRALPPSEQIILQTGFQTVASREFQGGFLRAVIFQKT